MISEIPSGVFGPTCAQRGGTRSECDCVTRDGDLRPSGGLGLCDARPYELPQKDNGHNFAGVCARRFLAIS